MGFAIWEYTQEIGSGRGSQQALYKFRQRIIKVLDRGELSFEDFVSSSDKLVNCYSKHALVNILVDRLINNATNIIFDKK